MLVPAAADPAAAGLALAIDGPRATIAVDRQDHVAVRAPALSASLRTALAGIGRSLPGSIRLVVLRIIGGSPPSGHGRSGPAEEQPAEGQWSDDQKVEEQPAHHNAGAVAEWQAALGWLSRHDLFSVAVVSGYAVDALRLAIACDLRVVCDDAYLSLPGIHHGRIPALGVSRALVDLVGYGRALDLCVTGRGLSGAQAQAVGLADRLAAPADLDRAVEELVAALLAAPRETAVEVKALLLHSRERSRPDQLRAERDAQLRCSPTPAGSSG
ncbi:enoyl-CoA hydratase/isomerase family protein [Protofrankia symbiont of Coriaria ruscifolia]|uniref:Enoyl-CoA hydratase/isomerase n=1 Tax=Candidatus Protofrankia californiensis TaxID=1839754 RepID=A0A1C3NXY3_9ACTN|nr:enoyl-CoA hydratase/isomerase family protein [Protofrankia symbiont of Coriaria ruscifolia]SBW22423.1 enoyl-CoA hydratase/isomerase [Candidatus Protofrankia californiensis]